MTNTALSTTEKAYLCGHYWMPAVSAHPGQCLNCVRSAQVEGRNKSRPNTQCQECGKPLYRPRYRIAKGERIFCSQACKGVWVGKSQAYAPLYRSCKECGAKYKRSKLTQKYCSEPCRVSGRRDRYLTKCAYCGIVLDLPNFAFHRAPRHFCSNAHQHLQRSLECLNVKCAECGVALHRDPGKMNKTGRYYCTMKCMGAARKRLYAGVKCKNGMTVNDSTEPTNS